MGILQPHMPGAFCLNYHFQFHQYQRNRNSYHRWWSYLHKIWRRMWWVWTLSMLWLSHRSVCKWRLYFFGLLSTFKWIIPFHTCSWRISHSNRQQSYIYVHFPHCNDFCQSDPSLKGSAPTWELCCLNTEKGKKYRFQFSNKTSNTYWTSTVGEDGTKDLLT